MVSRILNQIIRLTMKEEEKIMNFKTKDDFYVEVFELMEMVNKHTNTMFAQQKNKMFIGLLRDRLVSKHNIVAGTELNSVLAKYDQYTPWSKPQVIKSLAKAKITTYVMSHMRLRNYLSIDIEDERIRLSQNRVVINTHLSIVAELVRTLSGDIREIVNIGRKLCHADDSQKFEFVNDYLGCDKTVDPKIRVGVSGRPEFDIAIRVSAGYRVKNTSAQRNVVARLMTQLKKALEQIPFINTISLVERENDKVIHFCVDQEFFRPKEVALNSKELHNFVHDTDVQHMYLTPIKPLVIESVMTQQLNELIAKIDIEIEKIDADIESWQDQIATKRAEAIKLRNRRQKLASAVEALNE